MPGFTIDYLQGDRAGKVDQFDQDVVRVGRCADFELIFDEMGVSWEHAEIRRRDGDFWVIDRGSTNGTYVNDERAHNARLRDGDVLKFGKKGPVLRFRLAAAPASGHFAAVAAAPAAPAALAQGPAGGGLAALERFRRAGLAGRARPGPRSASRRPRRRCRRATRPSSTRAPTSRRRRRGPRARPGRWRSP
ncbi:MAG: FHA domain-containing protein [Planctomycetes bacterium]|nr:FHA domain-containing protein [Planctomycetota bacterium]